MHLDIARLSVAFVFLLAPLTSSALVLSINDSVPMVRPKTKDKTPAQEPYKGMAQARKAENEGNFGDCFRALGSSLPKAKLIAPWLHLARLRCSYQAKGSSQSKDVLKILNELEKNREWFSVGPYAPKLRYHSIEARFAILEPLLKNDRNEAVKTLDKLLELVDWMDAAQRSRAYRYAGELAFVQQKLKKAETYFRNSLSEKDSGEVRDRLNSMKILMKEKGTEMLEPTPRPSADPDLVLSPKEKELSERINSSIRSGDLVAAVEDSVDLIKKFPGGQRSRWAADRIFEIYQSITSKDDAKYQALRSRVLGQMKSADGLRISAWVEKAYRLGFYADVIELAEPALKKLEGTSATTSLQSWLAHGLLYTGDEEKAKKAFQNLIEHHSGTLEAITAQFRLGLIEFRAKEYAAAIAHFERLLALPEAANFELPSHYWLWRSFQKQDDKRAHVEAAFLVSRFPLTYYGLRAQAELSENQVSIPDSPLRLRTEIDFHGSEKLGWERLQILLKAGWFDEAQLELGELLDPADPMTKALLSRYWASAMGYSRALKMMNQAWTLDPALQVTPLVKVVYPYEFKESVEQEAKKYSMEPALVFSLIRQESAFETRAVSTSNAMGLMQLIPPTAQEVANDLRLKNFNVRESPFQPPINIQMGTYYLNKMIRKFDGNVAWALAGYNAGPERFGRWVKARGLANLKTSNPEDETWMDDLPWSETNFYVKAILRNLLIYRSLDRGRVPLLNPVWAYESVEKK
jgi:soluble lytic murein transglycosylase